MGRKDRRHFLKALPAAVAAGMAAPVIAQQAQQQPQRISLETLDCAEKVFGIDFGKAEDEAALRGVNTNLGTYEQLRALDIPLDTEPAITFRPYLPGKQPKPGATPGAKLKLSTTPPAGRRGSVEDLAFLPVTALAGLIARREVSSTELTTMYLARLEEDGPPPQLRRHADRGAGARAGGGGRSRDQGRPIPRAAARHSVGREGSLRHQGHPDDLGRGTVSEAGHRLRRHDRRAAARCRRGPGREAVDGRARAGRSLVRRPDPQPVEPGAGIERLVGGTRVGDGGRLVGFAIGTETRGSIISPSSVNGVVGLRPTYGRVSRYGAMALSWTMDKIGPMCRTVEDCVVVFNAIYGPDGRDATVVDARLRLESGRAAVRS